MRSTSNFKFSSEAISALHANYRKPLPATRKASASTATPAKIANNCSFLGPDTKKAIPVPPAAVYTVGRTSPAGVTDLSSRWEKNREPPVPGPAARRRASPHPSAWPCSMRRWFFERQGTHAKTRIGFSTTRTVQAVRVMRDSCRICELMSAQVHQLTCELLCDH